MVKINPKKPVSKEFFSVSRRLIYLLQSNKVKCFVLCMIRACRSLLPDWGIRVQNPLKMGEYNGYAYTMEDAWV